MAFYLRKGFNLGPLRLNLSKSGLGLSAGVKGARIGVGPRGAYVHAGRGGLYFRQQLRAGGPAEGSSPEGGERRRRPSPGAIQEDSVQRHFESAESSSLIEEGQAALVERLGGVRRHTSRVAVVGILAAVVVCGWLFLWIAQTAHLSADASAALDMAWLAVGVGLVVALGVALALARRSDRRQGRLELGFDLDEESERRFMALHDALERLAACERVWLVETEQKTRDWKRHAGVGALIKRQQVAPSETAPKGVTANVPIMCLPAGRQMLYFFPSGVVMYDRNGVGAVSYKNLKAETIGVKFTEMELVPADAPVLGQTWRYVNKQGGPDRRFRDNQEFPVLHYGGIMLTSETGLNELFYASNPAVLDPVKAALDSLAAMNVTIRRQEGTAGVEASRGEAAG